MSYDVKYKHPANVIETPMNKEMIVGNPNDYNATDGGQYSGIAGYPKADDGVIKEIMFDESGAFGDVKPAKG